MKQGFQKINSGIIQTIAKNADRPDVIVNSLLPKMNSLEDIKNLTQIVGESNMVGIRQQLLSNIFTDAKSVGGKNLTPAGISKQIKNFGEDKLQAVLTPEQFSTLKDLEKVSIAMGKGEKILGGSQTAFNLRLGTGGGLVSLLVTGNLPAFFSGLVAVLGNVAFNKFIGSDFGQRLLTEGIKMSGKTGQNIQSIAPSLGKASLFGQQGNNIQESQKYEPLFNQ
jgi:hypothetical protein